MPSYLSQSATEPAIDTPLTASQWANLSINLLGILTKPAIEPATESPFCPSPQAKPQNSYSNNNKRIDNNKYLG